MTVVCKNEIEYKKLVEDKFSGEVSFQFCSNDSFDVRIGNFLLNMSNNFSLFLNSGIIDKKDGPAIIYEIFEQKEEWFIENGTFVNEKNKPSYIKTNTIEYMIRSPYQAWFYKLEEWYNEEGDFHCDHGPAQIVKMGHLVDDPQRLSYYIDGFKIEKDEFFKKKIRDKILSL